MKSAVFCMLPVLAGIVSPYAFAEAQKAAASSVPGSVIVLPPRMVAGEQASLAVLGSGGRLVAGAGVEFTGGERVTTDSTGRAVFTAPSQTGVLLAQLADRRGRASAMVLPASENATGVKVTRYPAVAAVDDRFVLEGEGFRGDPDKNRVTLAGQAALVLASSPIALVALPPARMATGASPLSVHVEDAVSPALTITLVSFELLAEEKALRPEQKGVLRVRVRGTDQRLLIEARNQTPEVVRMIRGDTLRVTSSGGVINEAAIELEGLRVGDYAVAVRLVPGVVGLPDVEGARQKLMAARQVAPAEWQERVERVIRRIERDPQDALRIRDELEKMLADGPPGEFGRLLAAAWQALLR